MVIGDESISVFVSPCVLLAFRTQWTEFNQTLLYGVQCSSGDRWIELWFEGSEVKVKDATRSCIRVSQLDAQEVIDGTDLEMVL